jgi:hypothetical protein
MTAQLSEKAIENLKRIEQCRNQQSKYIKLQPGEKKVLHFDPEKIEQVEMEFNDNKSIRYQYTVTDPDDEKQEEKYFTVGKRSSALIDACLIEGHSILKIHRIGAGKDTQYIPTPA